MTPYQINRLAELVFDIAAESDADASEVINALIGVAWDEEAAGRIAEQLPSNK